MWRPSDAGVKKTAPKRKKKTPVATKLTGQKERKADDKKGGRQSSIKFPSRINKDPLPIEIISRILLFCDDPTVARCIRLSQSVFLPAGRILYHHVHTTFHENVLSGALARLLTPAPTRSNRLRRKHLFSPFLRHITITGDIPRFVDCYMPSVGYLQPETLSLDFDSLGLQDMYGIDLCWLDAIACKKLVIHRPRHYMCWLPPCDPEAQDRIEEIELRLDGHEAYDYDFYDATMMEDWGFDELSNLTKITVIAKKSIYTPPKDQLEDEAHSLAYPGLGSYKLRRIYDSLVQLLVTLDPKVQVTVDMPSVLYDPSDDNEVEVEMVDCPVDLSGRLWTRAGAERFLFGRVSLDMLGVGVPERMARLTLL
ncbi:hypothetical protein M231_05229 [Tremella mesenterica]|uniref:F-box domain-containing protein n=2 Tax=Tremella mesenterica TaxID=5217 RepID=A0A4Q1BIM0_TREME|nr:hypothetical protein M231_05229 [Tremella mesenterica]